MDSKFYYIKQNKLTTKIKNIDESLIKGIANSSIDLKIFKDKKIGITVGSRGIDQIEIVLKKLVRLIEESGGSPYLIPAMGSHGGAEIQGQLAVLKSLKITEDNIGAPIIKNIETKVIGKTENGLKIYCNQAAKTLDYIIVMNRIKPHTDFSGEIESGLCKMLTIGLGSYEGAENTHSYALKMGYEETITEIAKGMMDRLPVVFGIGLIENWKSELEAIEIIPGNEIIQKEKELLKRVKKDKIDLPFKDIDILIVQEMGKNISGTGLDTKVIGRIKIDGQAEPKKPNIKRIVVLNLTVESHGNAIGVGLADVITRSMFEKIDLNITAKNTMTSMAPEQGKIPVIMSDDKTALLAAIKSLGISTINKLKIAYIKNTSRLEKLYISESLLAEVKTKKHIEIIDEIDQLSFNSEGKLLNEFCLN